ncbi:MAG: cell envelope integrity protein TolA [Gammaproteobacteria bacterium]|nr:MAG: cell envelope integrity protein TolA [Gammaproteobacteria bacterium]
MTLSRTSLLPIFLSVLLHAVLIAFIILRFDFFKKEPEPYEPNFVTATLVDLTPKSKPVPKQPKEQVLDGKNDPDLKQTKQQKEQEAQEAESKAEVQKEQQQKERAEAEAKVRDESLKKEKAKKEADDKAKADKQKKIEEEQKQLAEAEKKKKQDKQRREELKALEAQMQKEEQMLSNRVDDTNVNVKSYDQLFYEKVVRNWSRPPSAVKGMVAELDIEMLPNGLVTSVVVSKSSGDAAFDRSAVQAVKKIDRFEDVKNIPIDIFEKKYRKFQFIFNPEDLRR